MGNIILALTTGSLFRENQRRVLFRFDSGTSEQTLCLLITGWIKCANAERRQAKLQAACDGIALNKAMRHHLAASRLAPTIVDNRHW